MAYKFGSSAIGFSLRQFSWGVICRYTFLAWLGSGSAAVPGSQMIIIPHGKLSNMVCSVDKVNKQNTVLAVRGVNIKKLDVDMKKADNESYSRSSDVWKRLNL